MRRPSILILLIILFVGFASLSSLQDSHAGEPRGTLAEITRVEFATSGNGPWTPVSLPDTWALRGLELRGHGIYRLDFRVDRRPEKPWGLYVERLALQSHLEVNGHPIGDEPPMDGAPPRTPPPPAWLSLPPDLLRPGLNHLEIEIDTGSFGGLGRIHIGPAEDLSASFRLRHMLTRTLPLMLNTGGIALSLFMVLIWLRRSAEMVLGSFAAFWLIASVRNVSYYIDDVLITGRVSELLYFLSIVANVVLLGHFSIRFSAGVLEPTRANRMLLRQYRLSLHVAGAAAALLGLLAALIDHVPMARQLGYPILIALTLPSLVLIGRKAVQMHTASQMLVAAGITVVIGSSIHDFLFVTGRLSLSHLQWLPYCVPVALMIFAWSLIDRFVDALHRVEQINIELEERVNQRTQALRQSSAAKSRFLAAASHDLRQPLVAIGLMVGLLREQTLSPVLKRMVLRIDEAVASMENLLGGLLDLSRLEAGTVQPEIRSVALQDLFNAIASHEQEAALRKGLVLRFRPTRLATESDPVLLEQVIRNLVSNAVKHTRHGRVLVTARRVQGQIRLEVRDTGAGIPVEHQEKIFHEFVQIPTLNPGSDLSNRLESGLGLGLAIVRRISGLLGHRLSLRSEPGRGSCFRIDLPESSQPPKIEPETPSESQPLQGLCIVLVEDDDGVRESLVERLLRWGARVQAFSGQTEFRKSLASTSSTLGADIQLLISDYRLEDGNGFDTAEAVRKLRPTLPVLIITGDTSREDLTRLAQSGLPVLHKPFRTETLLKTLKQLLGAQSASS